ncbi:MAG: hypothetical protein SF066_20065 [Thermoanaerobaculia bacterium]|nr:hypothetical protein [Thermoanaerobaculia bacterium]
MSHRPSRCPDWRTLAATRDERDDLHGDAWFAALDHLDGGCRACRDAAYAADPTLVFRRAAAYEPTAAEVTDLAASVRAMIRAGRVEELPASDFDHLTRTEEPVAAPAPIAELVVRPRRVLGWRVASLAAGLVALLVATAPVDHEPAPTTVAASAPAVAYGTEFVGALLTAGSSTGDPVEIETLDRPTANVYQFDDPGMDVVLIVDAGLDV